MPTPQKIDGIDVIYLEVDRLTGAVEGRCTCNGWTRSDKSLLKIGQRAKVHSERTGHIMRGMEAVKAEMEQNETEEPTDG